MRCPDLFDFLPIPFVFNSYKREEPCLLSSLELFKSIGERIFCGNKIKTMTTMITCHIHFRVIKELSHLLHTP